MEMDKNKLIENLEEASALIAKALTIKEKMNSFTPEDHYERKVVVPTFPGEYDNSAEREEWEEMVDHEDAAAIDDMAGYYSSQYAPSKPVKPGKRQPPTISDKEAAGVKQKMGCLFWGGIFVGALAFLTAIITAADDSLTATLNWIIVAICAALIGFYYYKFNKAKKLDTTNFTESQRQYEELVAKEKAQYETAMAEYETAYAAYEVKQNAFIKEYTQWRKAYLDREKEEAEIRKKLEADRQAEVAKIQEEEFAPLMQEYAKVAGEIGIPPEYIGAVDTVLGLLKTDRADSLKEALNIYDEMQFREKQLQLQREQEAHRQQEEQLRREEEARRHEEDMQFRREQEEQRRYEERQRQRAEEQRRSDEERRHKEDMALREKQERDRKYEENRRREEDRRREERAENEQRQKENRDTRDQCNRCAQVGHCSMAFRRPNCASFRPK